MLSLIFLHSLVHLVDIGLDATEATISFDSSLIRMKADIIAQFLKVKRYTSATTSTANMQCKMSKVSKLLHLRVSYMKNWTNCFSFSLCKLLYPGLVINTAH